MFSSYRHVVRNAVGMPDRPFPAVEALIRRVQRVAASRPDPMHIRAQTISMTGAIGADLYAGHCSLMAGSLVKLLVEFPGKRWR
jgi:hypothetical protein